MFYLLLIINSLLYGLYCYIGYLKDFKQSNWFIPLSLSIVIIGNLFWIYYLKFLSKGHTDILMSGIIWDALITIAYIAVPFYFFNIQMSFMSKIGLVLCILGLIIMKTGDLFA